MNTYVVVPFVADEDRRSNHTDTHLITNEVYIDKRKASEFAKKHKGNVITLGEWAQNNFEAGYVEAYG